LHLLWGEPSGDRVHQMSVSRTATLTLFEEVELQAEIIGMLPAKDGINRIPSAGAGAMTINAGRHALTRHTLASNRLAALDFRSQLRRRRWGWRL
jgi:hypothetical protein